MQNSRDNSSAAVTASKIGIKVNLGSSLLSLIWKQPSASRSHQFARKVDHKFLNISLHQCKYFRSKKYKKHQQFEVVTPGIIKSKQNLLRFAHLKGSLTRVNFNKCMIIHLNQYCLGFIIIFKFVSWPLDGS